MNQWPHGATSLAVGRLVAALRGLLRFAKRVCLRSAMVVTFAASASLAQAEQYALLVGVNQIAALPPRLWLRGPSNDVTLMRQALLSRGLQPQYITVLAQQVPGAAGLPTYAAIASNMAALRERVRPGDTVFLHLAGHGAQVPAPPGAEPDGLDEVFLTADVQRWDASTGRLPNGLLDDEIGAWMDALVDRGAKVWAVFDTCHAAGMARGNRTTRWRSVAAGELGVPNKLSAPGRTDPAVIGRTVLQDGPRTAATRFAPARLDGRVLAFAARAHETTGEEWLPRASSLAYSRMYGVFSYAVAAALRDGAESAAALRDAVRRSYAQDGRAVPVPQVLAESAPAR